MRHDISDHRSRRLVAATAIGCRTALAGFVHERLGGGGGRLVGGAGVIDRDRRAGIQQRPKQRREQDEAHDDDTCHGQTFAPEAPDRGAHQSYRMRGSTTA